MIASKFYISVRFKAMSLKLYVDTITSDWSMASTYIDESISYNLVILNPFIETFSPIFSVGKYVVIHSFSLNDFGWAKDSLEFMDLRKNPDLIQYLKTLKQFSNSQDQLTSFLEDYNSTYDSNKDAVKLILGAHPIIPRGSPSFN
jgi:hypothetical protein